MSHDPADTLSMVLPSLPPPAPGEGLSVLDPRFPIRLSEPAHIFWQLTAEWEDRETVITQTIRATQQAAVGEERFVRPLPPIDVSPAALPPPPLPVAPVVYQALTEPELTHEFETVTSDAIPEVDDLPRRHGRRGEGGRFVAAGGAS